MLAASRLLAVRGLIILVAAGSLSACQQKAAQKSKPQPQPLVAKRSPEEIKKLADSARESLEGLKPALNALNDKFKALHRQFDPLPPDLPEFESTRGKFNSADEGLGRMNAKIPWLSNRLEAAVNAGDSAELEEISRSIASSYLDIPEVNRVAMELLHEVRPFIKLAEQYEADRNSTCAPDKDKLDLTAVGKKLSTR